MQNPNNFYGQPNMQEPNILFPRSPLMQTPSQQMMPEMAHVPPSDGMFTTIGFPGQSPAPVRGDVQEITPTLTQEPETLSDPAYVAGFLARNVGRLMNVEFLLNDQVVDRFGRLVHVGAAYILLQTVDPNVVIMCDIYSIKFVSIVATQGEHCVIVT